MTIVAWLLLVIILGTSWLAMKSGLEAMPPLTFAWVRFGIGAIILGLALRIRGVPLPRDRGTWVVLATTGVLSISLSYGIGYWGCQHISSGLGSVLFSTQPLLGLLIAHVTIAGEPITRPKLVGILLGLGGLSLIFLEQLRLSSSLALWGAVAVLAAAVFTALAQVLVKLKGQSIDPLVVSFGQTACGALLLIPFGLALEGMPVMATWSGPALLSILYLTFVATAVGFFLFYWLLQRTPVTRVQLVYLVSTVLAVVLGVIVRGEQVGWRIGLGSAVVLVGVAISLRPDGRRRGIDVTHPGAHNTQTPCRETQ